MRHIMIILYSLFSLAFLVAGTIAGALEQLDRGTYYMTFAILAHLFKQHEIHELSTK